MTASSQTPTISAKVTGSSDTTVTLSIPAGLGGKHVVTISNSAGTATTEYTYVTTNRSLTAFEQQVIDEVNARRTAPGGQICGSSARSAVPALPVNPKLNDLAQSHANDLGYRWETDYGSKAAHPTAGTTSSSVRYRAAGFKTNPLLENWANAGASWTAKELVDSWMASSSHCDTIMDDLAIGFGLGTWTGPLSGWSTERRLAILDVETSF